MLPLMRNLRSMAWRAPHQARSMESGTPKRMAAWKIGSRGKQLKALQISHTRPATDRWLCAATETRCCVCHQICLAFGQVAKSVLTTVLLEVA